MSAECVVQSLGAGHECPGDGSIHAPSGLKDPVFALWLGCLPRVLMPPLENPNTRHKVIAHFGSWEVYNVTDTAYDLLMALSDRIGS